MDSRTFTDSCLQQLAFTDSYLHSDSCLLSRTHACFHGPMPAFTDPRLLSRTHLTFMNPPSCLTSVSPHTQEHSHAFHWLCSPSPTIHACLLGFVRFLSPLAFRALSFLDLEKQSQQESMGIDTHLQSSGIDGNRYPSAIVSNCL